MATAVKVLDKHRVAARARLVDVAALLILTVAGFSLMVMLYKLGYSAHDAFSDANAVVERDRLFVVAIVIGSICTACLAWIGYRLLTATGRRPGG